MKFILLGQGRFTKVFLDIWLNNFETKFQLVSVVTDIENVNLFFDKICKQTNFFLIDPHKKQEELLENLVHTHKPDFILSIQYPWILSKKFIDLCEKRIINFHNAKLPDYRGHYTISHEILNNEKEHFLTLHWIEPIVDRGKIILERKIKINVTETAYSLWEKSIKASKRLFKEFLLNAEKIVKNYLGRKVKPGGEFYSRLNIEKYKKIEKKMSYDDLYRYARAFFFPGYEPAYIQLKNGSKLYLLPNKYICKIKNDG